MELYEKLESDYIQITGGKPKITYGGEADELNAGCPAQVWPNDEIKIWDGLEGRDLIEAKAHETGHIILRYRGLVAFDIADKYEAECACGTASYVLCMEINDAISHRFLLPMLKDEYQIDSIVQRKERCHSPDVIAETVSLLHKDTTRCHIEGIIAYDTFQCNFMQLEQIELVLNVDPEIRRAFDLSLKYLSEIRINQPLEEQIEIAKSFFDGLGYPPKVFKIMEPFPLLKPQHRSLLNVGLTGQQGKSEWQQSSAFMKALELASSKR